MGLRGPQRTPGSQRWRAELKKKMAIANGRVPKIESPVRIDVQADLPKCPRTLSRSVADKWLSLLLDMVAAGIQVKQVDARAIAIGARYEQAMERWDELCERKDIEPEILVTALRSQQAAMKEYLAALEKIGGTPLIRMRARIKPEEKQQPADDPWASF